MSDKMTKEIRTKFRCSAESGAWRSSRTGSVISGIYTELCAQHRNALDAGAVAVKRL